MRIIVFPSVVDRPEAHLFAELKSRGIDIELLGTPEPESRKVLEAAKVPITECRPRGRIDFKAIKIISDKIKEKRIDLIHSFSSSALSNSLLATRGSNTKHVAYRGTMGNISRFDPVAYLTYFHPRVDKIMCVSDAVREYLNKRCKISAKKLVTIYKGHQLDWYNRGKSDLTQFKIPKDAFVVTLVANMRPVKGADIFLEAIKLIDAKDIHFILVGKVEDSKVAKLLEVLKDDSRVHSLGFRADATEIVAASSLFVMPSVEREGLPKAVIEAMAQAVPVVVSAVGGMKELVVDGDSGLVIPPSDAVKVKDAILRIYKDKTLAKKLAENGQQRIASEFSMKTTADSLISLYTELLSR